MPHILCQKACKTAARSRLMMSHELVGGIPTPADCTVAKPARARDRLKFDRLKSSCQMGVHTASGAQSGATPYAAE